MANARCARSAPSDGGASAGARRLASRYQARAFGGIEPDVVADGTAGCLCGPLADPMGEPDWAGQPVGGGAAGRVGQVREWVRQPQL